MDDLDRIPRTDLRRIYGGPRPEDIFNAILSYDLNTLGHYTYMVIIQVMAQRIAALEARLND